MNIAYGGADYSPNLSTVTIGPSRALRLNNSPYVVDDLTEAARTGTAAEKLAFLRDYHETLCGEYAKRRRQFVVLYFRWIDDLVAAARPALEQRAANYGGLFAWQDYAFSALRPLPQAHLPAGDARISTDVAFWTGERLVAVDIAGETRGATWAARCQRLQDTGVQIVEIPVLTLVKADPVALNDLLPAGIAAFWQSETMPSSPFKSAALGDIVSEEPEF
jgi:hypothetical protein